MEGRIIKALSGYYYVDTGSQFVTCRARGKFRLDGTSPLVGDCVQLDIAPDGTGSGRELRAPLERALAGAYAAYR